MLLPSKIIGENFYANNGFFSGSLTQLNTDTTFSEITTGTAYEISEITAADGAVVTFAGGDELVTNGDIESAIPTMNGVSLSYFAATGSQDAGQAHGGSSSLKVTSTGVYSSARFLDGPNCGLVSGTWYKISCWVYIPSGQTCYGATMTYRIAGDSTETVLDSVSTTDSWVNLVGYYQGFDPERVIQVIGNGIVATEFFYIDDISIKPLHSFDANDVVVIGGVASDEGLGSSVVTGTDSDMSGANNWVNNSLSTFDINSTVAGKMYMLGDGGSDYCDLATTLTAGKCYYVSLKAKSSTGTNELTIGSRVAHTAFPDQSFVITPTTSELTYTGIFTSDQTTFRIGRSSSDNDMNGVSFEIDDVAVAEVLPTQAKPYRITSIDANGACTLGDADFSDMATAITSAYASEASFTNYTVSALGWMPGTDVDPTPIDSGTLTLDTVYFITATEADHFGTGYVIYDYFTSDGTETCDSNNTVLAMTDTYAYCDGSNTTESDLESSEATIINVKGYKTTIELDSIDGGNLTPIISTKEGLPIDTASTNEQNIKANGTDSAKVKASTAVNSAIVKNFTIEQYN